MNPYEVLGVQKTATKKEITRAYRARAQACHPDHHPNDPQAASTFKALSEAYEVLSDEIRRKLYDETGATHVTDHEREAQKLMAGILLQITDKLTEGGSNIESINLMEVLRNSLRGSEESLKKQLRELTRARDNILKVVKRLKRKKVHEENILAKMVQVPLPEIEEGINQLENQLKVVAIAQHETAEYEYQYEKPANPGWTNTATTTTSQYSRNFKFLP